MKTGKLTQLSSTDSCAPSVCEACGEQFTCGATLSGCWCMEMKLTESLRARLRERYSNCLCRSCLERFIAAEEAGGPEKILS